MVAEDGLRLPIANRSKALPASEGAKKIGQQDRINQSGKLYRVASDQVLRMPAVYHLRHNMVQNSFATGSLVDVLCGVCVYYYYNCGGPASDRRACSHRFWSSYRSLDISRPLKGYEACGVCSACYTCGLRSLFANPKRHEAACTAV